MSKKVKTIVEQQLVCADCGKPVALGKPRTNVTRFLFWESRCNCLEKDIETSPPAEPVESLEPEPEPDLKAIEARLGARYEVLSLIGRGGMGVVYKVRDTELGRTFAIKMLDAALVSSQLTKKRFEQESKAAKQLTHANLCAVYDFGVGDDGAPFIVMDYLDGTTVAEILKRDGALDKDRALPIFSQICEGIAHAHTKGVVHRDLKPENIMITHDGDLDVVKVVDFGIAQVLSDELRATQRLTRTGDIFGSPFYMSPEQCLGNQNDVRSDIYALGCLLYEMLTGDPPLVGENPIRTILKHINEEPIAPSVKKPRAKISVGLDQIILRCLAKQPNERYQSASELLLDLQALQAGRPLQKRPGTTFSKAIKRASQSWSLPALVAVFLLIIAIGATIVQRNQEVQTPPPNFGQAIDEQFKGMTGDEIGTIANAYQIGSGVPVDLDKARRLFELGAARGSSNCLVSLGLLHEDAIGTPMDLDKAVKYYRRAADKGNMVGIHNLAVMYDEGKGVKHDPAMAVQLYKKATEQNYVPSLINLGAIYERGVFLEQDYEQAMRMYKLASEQYHNTSGLAAHNVGVLYERGLGVPADPKQAFVWYSMAMQKGNPGELATIARCYLNGTGVPVDTEHAVSLLQRAAHQQSVDAFLQLGELYEKGNSVPKNIPLAVGYYRQASAAGSDSAKLNLVRLHKSGQATNIGNVEELAAEGLEGLKHWSEQGASDAQFHLGEAYQYGLGTSTNMKEALRWYKLSAAQKDPYAIDKLKELAGH